MLPTTMPVDITPLARRSLTWCWIGFANWYNCNEGMGRYRFFGGMEATLPKNGGDVGIAGPCGPGWLLVIYALSG